MLSVKQLIITGVLAIAIDLIHNGYAEELTAVQMDRITAGALSATVDVNAAANAGIFALTNTSGYAATYQTDSDNPSLKGYAGVASGTATTTTVGAGSSSSTSVNPKVEVPAGNVQSYTVADHVKIGVVEINTNTVAKFSTPQLLF